MRSCKMCEKTLIKDQKKYCSRKCYWKDPEAHKNDSKAISEKWKEPEYLNKMMTKRRSVEYHKKASKSQKIRYEKPEEHEKIRKGAIRQFSRVGVKELASKRAKETHNTVEYKIGARERRLKQVIPFKDTTIEITVQNCLKELNITFETHKAILGQPDLFIEPNICIFCDGDYFHANPDKYKASDIIMKGLDAQKIWDRDKFVTETLESEGYKVLRFWEYEIKNNIEDVKRWLYAKM